jgi:hypothetical protein
MFAGKNENQVGFFLSDYKGFTQGELEKGVDMSSKHGNERLGIKCFDINIKLNFLAGS